MEGSRRRKEGRRIGRKGKEGIEEEEVVLPYGRMRIEDSWRRRDRRKKEKEQEEVDRK